MTILVVRHGAHVCAMPIDLFDEAAEVEKAATREWWEVEAGCEDDALRAARAWPRVLDGTRIVAHGRGGMVYRAKGTATACLAQAE